MDKTLFSLPTARVSPWPMRLATLRTFNTAPRVRAALPFVVPVVLLIGFTAACEWANLDILVSQRFYDREHSSWPLVDAPPCVALYHLGPCPALAIGIGGLALALVCCTGRFRCWGKVGLFLAVTLALGPGCVINGILKPSWNRPRPNQIRRFGGKMDFVMAGGWVTARNAKSFPSGHASMGFYLMTPAFLLLRRRPLWATAFILLGLVAGGVLGFARIAQGRHFLSDVIWSAAIVYFCGLSLAYILGFHQRRVNEGSAALSTTPDRDSPYAPLVVAKTGVKSSQRRRRSNYDPAALKRTHAARLRHRRAHALHPAHQQDTVMVRRKAG